MFSRVFRVRKETDPFRPVFTLVFPLSGKMVLCSSHRARASDPLPRGHEVTCDTSSEVSVTAPRSSW